MFKPWVGEQFGHRDNQLGGLRLLVLGESHYAAHADAIGTCEPDATTDVVLTWALDKPHRFFTNLTQLIGGQEEWRMGQTGVEQVWHSVAFYNYCPVYVGDGPRQRPKAEMFAAGAIPFQSLLDDLQIGAVLVCGYELWWWVLTGAGLGDMTRAPFVELGGAPAARIKHPSTAFNWRTWRPTYEALIARSAAAHAQAT